MKRYQTKRVYQVRCQSGIMGWRTRLQNNYVSLSEFESANAIYGLAHRLGVKDSCRDLLKLWEANPVIEGSIIPSDFRKVCS